MHPLTKPPIPSIVRWTARVTGLLLFLLWGTFFVEHLAEWFSDPANLPPLFVFAGQILHGLMLAGFIVAWRWEFPGALMIIVFSLLFFLMVHALVFFPVTIIPAILSLAAWRLSREHAGDGQ